MRVLRGSVSVVLVLVGVSAVASAAPTLRVKAQTRIDAHASRSHGSLVLQGQVKDDLAAPIAQAAVTISLKSADGVDVRLPDAAHGTVSCASPRVTGDGSSLQVVSDEAGRFCVRVPLPPMVRVVTVTTASSDYLSAASVAVPADLTRQAVVLAFDPEPRIVSLDSAPADLEVKATLEEDDTTSPAASLALVLESESGDSIGTATTDDRGRARFRLDPSKLGLPGRGELVVKYAGSDGYAQSVHHAHIERDAQVTLAPTELVRGGIPEDGIPIAIKASTKRGPIGSGSVEAKVGDVIVGAGAVSASGEADLVVTFGAQHDKEIPIRVRYVPDTPWLKSGDELLINLPVETPSPLRQVPLVVIGGALAAWLIAGRLARRRSQQPRASVPSRSISGVAGISVIEGAPRSRRGPLGGRVVDAHDGTPLARVRVAIEESRIQDVQVIASAFTDAEGRFRLEAQATAAMHLVCEGPLHAQLRQAMPHASEVEVALVLRKRRVLDRLVRWARAAGGSFDQRPEPTPGHVRREATHEQPKVEQWAAAVERAAYDDGIIDARAEEELDRLHPGPPHDPQESPRDERDRRAR